MGGKLSGRAFLVLFAGLSALVPVPARADVVVIKPTTTFDIVGRDHRCSLREAITVANRHSGGSEGECWGGHTTRTIIKLQDRRTYVLSIAGPDDDTNQSGDLDITSNVTIVGGRYTIIQQTQRSRVIDVLPAGRLVLSHISIWGGHSPDGDPSGDPNGSSGGGIRNAGTLTLSHCRVSYNETGAGVARAAPGPGGDGGNGGGIANGGSLLVRNTRVTRNVTGDGADGAANGGAAGHGGDGGAIYSSGPPSSLTIRSSRIQRNRTGNGGDGASSPAGPTAAGRGGDGGGVMSSGSMVIERSEITANLAARGGAGAQGVDGINGGTGGSGGDAGSGGGIASLGSLNLRTTMVIGNAIADGGTGGAGSDSAPAADGGPGGDAGSGAGLFVQGSATIERDTFAYSHVSPAGVGGKPGVGGGAQGANGGGGIGGAIGVIGAPPIAIRNTTFEANGAPHGGSVGATTSVLLNNVTIRTGGYAVYAGGGTFVVQNSLFAFSDCAGPVTSGGHNLVQGRAACPTLTRRSDIHRYPKTGIFGDHGGPTKTLELLPGSPAIDHGAQAKPGSGGSACEAVDQRGFTRSDCDIGAFEL